MNRELHLLINLKTVRTDNEDAYQIQLKIKERHLRLTNIFS